MFLLFRLVAGIGPGLTGLTRRVPRALGMILSMAAGACATYDPSLYPPRPESPQARLFVVSHDWHTGIVLNGQDVREKMPAIAADFRHAGYIEFGWGEAEFYPAPEETSGMALKAAFLPNESVLHVAGFAEPPERYFGAGRVVEVRVSRAGLEQLADYLNRTVALDPDGRALGLGKGLYGDSRFYKAHGTYHIFNNCNTWIARALQTTGAPIRSAWVFTADDVMDQVKPLQ